MSVDSVNGSAYRNILVATDFSEASRPAFETGIWLARQDGVQLTLTHSLPDIRHMVETASYRARFDFLYGNGDQFYEEVSRNSEAKLRQMISKADCAHLNVQTLTLLGSAYVEISRAVQQKGFDLVIAGTLGLSDWERFLIGSTSSRLIQKCPSSVWVVKGNQRIRPATILATTDFSETSRKAVLEGLRIAKLAKAEFHLLHSIDHMNVPDDILALASHDNAGKLREVVTEESERRFDEFVKSMGTDEVRCQPHLTHGSAWQEIDRLATKLQADLVVIGTVGRSGLRGLLLGNTAEKVLHTCDVSVLTVKPADFVSPILPPFAPMTPVKEAR